MSAMRDMTVVLMCVLYVYVQQGVFHDNDLGGGGVNTKYRRGQIIYICTVCGILDIYEIHAVQ